MPQGKESVKIERLREPYRTKYEIWQIMKGALNNIRSWEELKSYLHNYNIEISFKYKGTTQDKQGIIFSKGKYSFKGSAIDRNFSYAKIDHQIRRNIFPKQQKTLKQTLQKPCSDQSKSLNKIILSNLTNYLNPLSSKQNKLLHWKDNDKDEDNEDEEIKEEMKRKGRSIR